MSAESLLLTRKNNQERVDYNALSSIIRIREAGYITPELKSSIIDEECSYIEEGINAPQDRSYEYTFDGQDLYDIDGNSITKILNNGLEHARNELSKRKALADQKEGTHLIKMMRNEIDANTMISFRPYPKEAKDRYTPDQLEVLGYQPDRELGFMAIFHKVDNKLFINFVSLDGADPEDFRLIALDFNQPIPSSVLSDEFQAYPIFQNTNNPEKLKSSIVHDRDDRLEAKTGIRHVQGRPINSHEILEVEISQFIKKQPELVEWYWQELVKLSDLNFDSDYWLERQKKKLTYSFWAEVKKRYDNPSQFNLPGRENIRFDLNDPYLYHQISTNVFNSGYEADKRGEKLVGCGGSIKSLFNMNAQEARDFIFGENETLEEDSVPDLVRCINKKCRMYSKKEQVIQLHDGTWRCPHCKYEVDVCSGDVLNDGQTINKEIDTSFISILKNLIGDNKETKN